MRTATLLIVVSLLLGGRAFAQSPVYSWKPKVDSRNTLVARIAPPRGYTRVTAPAGSFAAWLRQLPLKKGHPPVHLYNGQLKGNQSAHHAVVDIDVSTRDLQQCADAVMRLRAEYLYAGGNFAGIHFNYTSGFRCEYAKWADGYRPRVRGNRVSWVKSAKADRSYPVFRAYLDNVFMYAGTASLSKELRPVADVKQLRIGDIFIHGGFPGHAMLVVDMAVDSRSGKRLFLLAQSYMPAQEIHLVKNPMDPTRSPWYPLDFGNTLHTPEWTFAKTELKRFP